MDLFNSDKIYNVLNEYLPKISDVLSSIDERSKSIENILKRIEFYLIIPGDLKLQIIGEDMDNIIFDVNLPSLGNHSDVVVRELTVTTVEESIVKSVDYKTTVVAGLRAPQNTKVDLSLIDIDDAGNRSQPAKMTFMANDTIAPPKPGDLGVIIVDEEILPSPCCE